MHYKLINNEYHLFDQDNIFVLNAGKELSISYSYSNKEDEVKSAILFKHGSYQEVLIRHNVFVKYFNEYNKIKKEVIIDINEHFMLTAKFDIEEINKALSISSYIAKIHEKYVLENNVNEL